MNPAPTTRPCALCHLPLRARLHANAKYHRTCVALVDRITAPLCPIHFIPMVNGCCSHCDAIAYRGPDEDVSIAAECQQLSDKYEDENPRWEMK